MTGQAPGVEVVTVLDALRAGTARRDGYAPRLRRPLRRPAGFRRGRGRGPGRRLVVAVVGDEAGLFGRGTSGEGCDVTELRLPGVQEDLLHALADTGTPVVAVLVTGRPYAIGDVAGRLAAVVQAFFPGEEGGPAIAGVLSGRVVPSGRLPVEMPGSAAGQPSSYLRSRLAAGTPAAPSTRRRCSPSGTACPTPRSGTPTWPSSAARSPTDGAGRDRLHRAQHRLTGRGRPRSCSST